VSSLEGLRELARLAVADPLPDLLHRELRGDEEMRGMAHAYVRQVRPKPEPGDLGEDPLLLLDDVFGILDTRRVEIITELLQSPAIEQSILTAARRDALAGAIPFDRPEHCAIQIVNGRAQRSG
jgi:hypothetical protein